MKKILKKENFFQNFIKEEREWNRGGSNRISVKVLLDK
jgi:hypothetical protein